LKKELNIYGGIIDKEKDKLAINIKDMDVLRPIIAQCHTGDVDGQT
jgi:hypothetical protein